MRSASGDGDRLASLLRTGIEEGVFPGAVAAVGSSDGPDRLVSVGTADAAGETPVTDTTLFDVASLTKAVATTTIALRLVERGELTLEAPLARYVPPLADTARGDIPIRSLLTHTSGLPPYKAFPFGWESREAVLESLYDSPLGLLAEPDEWFVYSDLNFVHLCDALCRHTDRTFPELTDRYVLEPAGMGDSRLAPVPEETPVAETKDWRWRERVLRGEVHDYLAAAMGAESGNAGLFATAPDLARFARLLLNDGAVDGYELLAPSSVDLLRRDALPEVDPPHGLGWRLADGTDPAPNWSPTAFGHTGFTGSSLWIDPEADRYAVLLTNHLLLDTATDPIARFRRRFHGAVAAGGTGAAET